MEINANNSGYEKKGYLLQDFKVFRLKDAPDSHQDIYSIPFHYHDFHKIILLLKGKAGYIIEGKTYPLQERDILFVSAGEIHRPVVEKDSPYERIIIYISPEFLKTISQWSSDDNSGNVPEGALSTCFSYAKKHSAVMHLTKGSTHDLLFHMDKLERTARDKGFCNRLYTQALFVEFMILLNRALLEHEVEEVHASGYDKKILPIIKYINDHLFENLSIDMLAEHFYLSRFHMMRKFKHDTGMSIHQYILSKRLLVARDMLKTSAPLTKICFDCGFKDYSTFSRAFKKQFDETPSEFRSNKNN